ncbi:TPA: hypothetical protein ACROQ1_003004 [Staphylococcus aureus]|uniref:hypothetical protein n=1 Tax=Staphylococcus sp. HMSC067F07 TaxID=1715185 RepID=UPI0008A8A149|nr:hypothetical protein [Staphylococcus sp. HMSC067F07]OHQ30042.1 hypothetical protein HMPREF2706_00795 [Staphylococcus sp. HMSC067F07]HCW9260152.1 hypothetical protein [Staphylococcus aureus]
MNQRIVKIREEHDNYMEPLHKNVRSTQERINKDKSKLAKHKRKVEKAQLEYRDYAKGELLEMIDSGEIDVKDLSTIQSYLFDDSGSLDVSSEVDVSSSATDETAQSTSSHSDVDHNPFADANRHS